MQINKIKNERENIRNNATEMHRIIREYYEKLYANKYLETHLEIPTKTNS